MFLFPCAGRDASYHLVEHAPSKQPVKVQPIAVPAISVEELKEVTENFGSNALIGEGSYGRVYYGVLKNGHAAAIKKLDASKQPDDEFLAQVRTADGNVNLLSFVLLSYCVLLISFYFQVSMVSRLKHENFVELLGYCVEGNQRVLAYEFASNGSLHDILHGELYSFLNECWS